MMMNPYLAIIKLDYDVFLKYLFGLLNVVIFENEMRC